MIEQLQKQKNDFITYLKIEKNLSDHTLRAYESDLNQFFEFWNHLNPADKTHLAPLRVNFHVSNHLRSF